MSGTAEDSNGSTKSPPAQQSSYRPVVIVHGLMTGDVSTMQRLASRITELHPGTRTYVIDRFCGLASLEPLWHQTRLLADDLLQICALHPEGVHIIGYSQGGLISRGMLEMHGAIHNVRTFVSLSSPQGGQFGAKCFTKMFPALTAHTAYEVFYTRLGQHTLSVANYWYDPRHRDLYLKYSLYLAVIDNVKQDIPTIDCRKRTEIQNKNTETMEDRVTAALAAVSAATVRVAEGHDDGNAEIDDITSAVETILADVSIDNADYGCDTNTDDLNTNANIRKLGLTRLQRMVLIGGPDDGVISPWQSSQFAVLDSTGGLVPMRERLQNDVFSDNDPIGLRLLDKTNRLIEYTVPGVGHHEWHCNEKVLRECIIDWLD